MLLRRKTDLIALLGFAALSFAFFGWPLVPHPTRVLVGSSLDPQIFVWDFAWWPHAIAHWLNPFVSHAVYSPSGVNLMWVASVPGLALAFSPLTYLFGPIVSADIAMLLMPALCAWTAYLLCRYLTRSLWASLVGGYLYGFSGSILREQVWGNLHVTSLFVLPLIALVIIRALRGDLTRRGFSWRFGALLAFQFSLSTEFAYTASFVLVFALALAFWLVREVRPSIRSLLVPLVWGYALAGALASPFVFYAIDGFVSNSFEEGQNGGIDVVSFVVPSQAFAAGGSSFASFTSHLPDGGTGAYLGIPALLIIALFGWRFWSKPGPRFLLAALGLVCLVAVGSELLIDKHRVVVLPWDAISHLPGFSNAFPFRFMTYGSLAGAVIVAFWIANTKGRIYSRPYLLPLLAIGALVPAFWQPLFHEQPPQPRFFTTALARTCIKSGETVAIFPFGLPGYSLLWQADAGLRFDVADNSLQPLAEHGTPLNSFDTSRFVWELTFAADLGRPTIDRLLAFAATHHVDRILSVPGDGYPTRVQMAQIGPTQLVGGMLVSPACGKPSLATRDLAAYVAKDTHETIGAAPNVGYCLGNNFDELPEGLDPAGVLVGAKRAVFIAGQGLTCNAPPAGYIRRGFANADEGVPADTYAFYSPG
ncbi:MAG TPA: hypothetical protein VG652_07500 [Gaiellaceae bacterium]|nr:hypothetical protein [Gaiellaceae bacterium]